MATPSKEELLDGISELVDEKFKQLQDYQRLITDIEEVVRLQKDEIIAIKDLCKTVVQCAHNLDIIEVQLEIVIKFMVDHKVDPETTERIIHLRTLMLQHTRNVQNLRIQEASYGAGNAPIKVMNDILKEEQTIEALADQIDELNETTRKYVKD